jgi:hypothetical protein
MKEFAKEFQKRVENNLTMKYLIHHILNVLWVEKLILSEERGILDVGMIKIQKKNILLRCVHVLMMIGNVIMGLDQLLYHSLYNKMLEITV